jgi:hypothetical protein
MGAHCNRMIDWEIANMDGGLFASARRRSSDPLINVLLEAGDSVEPAVPTPVEEDLAPVTLASAAQELIPPEEPPRSSTEETAPVEAPARAPFKRVRIVAAALTVGGLIGSLCAMAFSTKLTPPEMPMEAAAAPLHDTTPTAAPAAVEAAPMRAIAAGAASAPHVRQNGEPITIHRAIQHR